MMIRNTNIFLCRSIALMALLCTSMMIHAQQESPLEVQVMIYKNAVRFDWFPTDATAWGRAWPQGYRIERYDLGDAGALSAPESPSEWDALSLLGGARIFPAPDQAIMMADSATLRDSSLLGQGYVGALAVMLYDSAFNDGTDPEGVLLQQYEMAAFGSLRIPDQVGSLLGTRWADASIDTLRAYLYRIVSVADPGVRQEIFVIPDSSAWQRDLVLADVNLDANPFRNQLPAPLSYYEFVADGKGFTDSLVLRWAPLNPELLAKSHLQGYQIIRERLLKPAQGGQPPVFAPAGDPINVMPWSKEQFAAYLSGNNNPDSLVYVSAQVLYGEVKADGGLSRQEILENQMVYGLQSADQSPVAADALGLRFVDYDVAAGERYRYSISMPLDSIDPRSLPVYAPLDIQNTYSSPPPLSKLGALEGEYEISLLLDEDNGDNYGYYYFERRQAGQTNWQSLSGNRPVIFEKDKQVIDIVSDYLYPDSVSTLYLPYEYRARGMNYFQEYSPWVQITAMARDRTPTSAPVPEEPQLIATDIVSISWDGAVCEEYADFAGYYVKMGYRDNSAALQTVSELIPAGTSSFEYIRPGVPFVTDSIYFFQVCAADTAGNISSSFSYLLSIIDSIPPAPPIGLQGSIDSNGIVTVVWEASPERDAAGYQVYFANDTSSTFAQVTEEDLGYNYFKDTITLQALNEAVYYRVSAFDRRFNTSGYSEILRLERPDVIAPTPPVLLLPKPTGTAVELSWRPSSSTDAVGYLVQRRSYDEETVNWVTIDRLSTALASYADTSVRAEETFLYRLITVDDAGLYSEPSNAQSGRRIFDANVGGVQNVNVSILADEQRDKGARTQVQWEFTKPKDELLAQADYRFMIYRSEGDAPLSRYKQLRSKEPVYIDSEVSAGKTYRYALMVVYANGKKSGMSPPSSVTIPDEKR